MGFNKKKLKEMQGKLDKLPLWKLILYTANIENHIIELKRQGLTSKDNIVNKTRYIRNHYREILLKKLIQWKKNPDSVDDIIDFDSVQINKFEEENILGEE
jgi:hypothetical protein